MPIFDIFASPRWSPLRMRTKVVSFFIFFQELSNKKKIKALRPKMTKLASRGSCLNKIRVFMFKIPDFSLVPRLCKQAGLDLVSARNDPRTLVSGDLHHFDTTVRCAAHYAGATLNRTYRWREFRFRGGTSETQTYVVSKCKSESSKAHRSVPTSRLDPLE